MRQRPGVPAAVIAGVLWSALASATPGPLVGWGSTGETGLRWDLNQGHATERPLVRESNLRGWVGLSLAGQVVDSRWLGWSWSVRPGFVRSRGSQPNAELATEELAHQWTASSQPWPWLRAQVSADRDRIVANRGEDATRESRFAHSDARTELRLPAFALGVSGRRERFDDRWTTTSLAPELERLVRREAVSSWLESSKMRLARERTREAVPGVAPDVRTTHTTFDHALRWGRGSRLATRLEWSAQAPEAATIVDRVVQEQLHVRHSSALSSDYRFEDTHARLVAGEGVTRSHYAELAARTDGIGLALDGGVRKDRSPGREGRSWSLGPRASWQRAWRGGARLSAETGASLEQERRSGAADARLAVSNESHTVTGTRSFALAVEGVDSVTVIVRDARSVTGYAPGLDWSLVRSGSQAFVQVPLGSRIAVGDVVLVSYEAVPPGAPSRRSLRADVALSGNWRGLSLRLEDRQRVARDTPRDRGAAGLGTREQAASLATAVPYGAARLDLSAGGRRRATGGRTARVDDAHAGLSWRASSAWMATGDVTISSAREPGSRLAAVLERASVQWNPGGAWRWGVHADHARFDHTGSATVTQRLAGIDAAGRWGLLDATARLDVGDRNGSPGHRFSRVSVALVRRLR